MQNNLPRKRNKKAFTIAEMLVTILIMLMVSSIVVAGIPSARNAYEGVVLSANAEVLLSTTISKLRNELGTADNIKVTDGTTVNYYNRINNTESKIYKGQTIMYQEHAEMNLNKAGEERPLVSEKEATNGLTVTYDSISPESGSVSGVITFNGLSVSDKMGNVLTKRDAVSIRIMPY